MFLAFLLTLFFVSFVLRLYLAVLDAIANLFVTLLTSFVTVLLRILWSAVTFHTDFYLRHWMVLIIILLIVAAQQRL